MDMIAYYKACHFPDRATPPARMSGGDKPLWDADMSRWLDDDLSVKKNPAYICADYGDANCVCGEINP